MRISTGFPYFEIIYLHKIYSFWTKRYNSHLEPDKNLCNFDYYLKSKEHAVAVGESAVQVNFRLSIDRALILTTSYRINGRASFDKEQ